MRIIYPFIWLILRISLAVYLPNPVSVNDYNSY